MLKCTHPVKAPAVWVAHLEQDGTAKEGSTKSDDPDGIKDMTEEFIVCLARAVKEAQQDEKHCYHCSSQEHLICEGIQNSYPYKLKGADGAREGSPDSSSQDGPT